MLTLKSSYDYLLLHFQQFLHGVRHVGLSGGEDVQRATGPGDSHGGNVMAAGLHNVQILVHVQAHQRHGRLDEVR